MTVPCPITRSFGSARCSRSFGSAAFIGSNDRKLYAVSADGHIRMTLPTIGPTGEVVVGSRDGSVYCFR